MFHLLLLVGIIGGIFCLIGINAKTDKLHRRQCCVGFVFCLALVIGSFFTAQGNMVVLKLIAGSKNANWLVIDNSGGETLRHWVIEDGYVESSSQSDGWQFYDQNGLCYVSGDAYVMKIDTPLGDFLQHYKSTYNIPSEQKPVGKQSSINERR